VGSTITSSTVALVVQKFGGTSVADPDRIRTVADSIARTIRRGNQVVVAVSAMGKDTDDLLRLATEVSVTRPGREMDMLITAGERKATALLCMALHDMGVDAESFTGSQAGFITDTTHTNAKILEVRADRIRDALDRGRVPVVAVRRACRPTTTSRSSVGAAPTPLRSRSLMRWAPTSVSSTPTSPASSPAIPAWCRTPGRWNASASTSCSR